MTLYIRSISEFAAFPPHRLHLLHSATGELTKPASLLPFALAATARVFFCALSDVPAITEEVRSLSALSPTPEPLVDDAISKRLETNAAYAFG